MKRKQSVVLLILLIFFVISFLTNILGALNPEVSLSFELSETMAGLLPFVFFIAYGVMSIPAGFMLEKVGAKKLMVFAFILAFFASLLFASFPGYRIFLVSLFAIGTGMAILQVVINPLLRVAGGEEHFAFNSLLAQLVFGSASFLSPKLYSWIILNLGDAGSRDGFIIRILNQLVPDGMSWVAMYYIFALFSLLMIVLILVYTIPRVELVEEEKVGTRDSYIDLLKNKQVILFFLGIFAYVGLEQGISYWMSKFLAIYHDLDYKTIGANAVGNFWGLLTLGGIAGLILVKLIDSKLVLRLFTVLAMLSLTLALTGGPMLSLYSFQSCGFFLSVMYPVIISLALNSVDKHHGSFAGILMSGIMGGAVLQLLIGLISDLTSLRTGMLLLYLSLAYIFSLSIWAKPLIKNKTISFHKESGEEK